MPPLHTYFQSGKVLFIGPTLANDRHWNLFLASELSGCNQLFNANEAQQLIGTVSIGHLSDVNMLLSNEMEDELLSFDVILLGLEAEQKEAEEQLSVVIKAVKEAYDRSEFKAVVAPLPEVLVFPTKPASLSVLRMLTERERPTFLHPLFIDGHAIRYTDFRQTLIGMLKNSVAFSLGLAFPRGLNLLDSWLIQFSEADQPLALRLLRYFKYYTAECQRVLIEAYLNFYRTESMEDSRSRVVWLSYLGRPNKSAPAVLTLAAKTSWARGILTQSGRTGLVVKSYDDLVSDLGPAIHGLAADQGIDIYLVDDVIGSGGQLVSYLKKFLNSHLWDESLDPASGFSWDECMDAIAVNTTRPKVTLNAVFVIGVSSRETEKLFSELQEVQVLQPELAGTRSKIGKLKIRVRNEEGSAFVEPMINVHIIDYTKSIYELFEERLLPREMIEPLLLRYSRITKPREKEHWLQFEPFGWKECGALVSTHMNCPGNTIPLIWGDGGDRSWRPLFPRYFNPWDDGSKEAEGIIDSIGFDAKTKDEANRHMVAYLLKSLTNESASTIARKVEIDPADIEQTLIDLESKLAADESYRDRLRELFTRVS